MFSLLYPSHSWIVSGELMKTFSISSLSICISCFGEVTKFLLSQLVLLFIAPVLVSCTFLSSLFLSLEVFFVELLFCLVIQISLLIYVCLSGKLLWLFLFC